MTSLSVAEAKKQLSELLGRVAEGGETILITSHGRPMAKLVPPDVTAPERQPRSVSMVEASWGAMRLDPQQVRDILRDEDGLLDS